MSTDPAPRIVATDAAVAEVRRLRDEHGPLMFFQSGGCCDGSSPMCFPDGELLLGPNDLLLGAVDGCSFHIDAAQYERWNSPALVLDVAAGSGSGMSLEETHGLHFVLRPPAASFGAGDARHLAATAASCTTAVLDPMAAADRQPREIR